MHSVGHSDDFDIPVLHCFQQVGLSGAVNPRDYAEPRNCHRGKIPDGLVFFAEDQLQCWGDAHMINVASVDCRDEHNSIPHLSRASPENTLTPCSLTGAGSTV